MMYRRFPLKGSTAGALAGAVVCALPWLHTAHAQSVAGSSSSDTSYGVTWTMLDPGDDFAATVIRSVFPVFGSSGTTSTGTEASVIGTMLGEFSGMVMAFAMAYVTYAFLMNTHRSAETSQVLGSNQTSMSIVRMCFAAIMMFPIDGGFNAGQAVVEQGALWGIGMARTLYASAVQAIGPDGKVIATPIVPGTKTTVSGLVIAEMCRDLVNLASNNANLVPAPTGISVSTQLGVSTGLITYNYDMAGGSGIPVCGQVTIDAPQASTQVLGVTVDAAGMQKDVLDSVLASDIRGPVLQVVQNYWNTRQSSSLAPLINVISTATNDYTNRLTAKAASVRSQVQSAVAKRTQSFQDWGVSTSGDSTSTKDQLDSLGWTGAGAYYLEFARLNGETLSLMASTPTVTAPSFTGLGDALKGDIAPIMRSASIFVENIKNMVATQDGLNAPGGNGDLYSGITPTGDGSGVLSQIARSLHLSDSVLQAGMAFIEPSGSDGYWTDPFGNLMGLGNWMITTALGAMAAAALMGSDTGTALMEVGSILTMNFEGAAAAGIGHAVVTFLSTPIFMGCLALLIPGLTLAFILPMIPWVMWMAAVAGWLVMVFEAMIAVPLWMLAHMTMSGEGLHGHARAGYALIFNVVFRPTLMLFGLFLGYYVFDATSWLIHQTFGVAAGFVLSRGWLITNLLGLVVLLSLNVMVHVTLAMICFRLISILPERVPAMIGLHMADRVDIDQFSRDAAVVGMAGALKTIQQSLDPATSGKASSKMLPKGASSSIKSGADTTMAKIS
ncbi:hypothetical protein AA0472_2542 [Acetobacter estunensis NRIC 0472]|nr:DotA/TraY family protein [Acetobacter estunensis]GBQ27926.1 hypothetical protein AA0472_2542 [Acetobacter estunensis NRIC 0472]